MGSISVPDPPCGGRPCADLFRQIAAAVDHRDVIGTAEGMVMISGNHTDAEAFALLRSESQHRNVKLWQVAEEWIADHHERIRLTCRLVGMEPPGHG
ncbi:MAG: ANTAR domain-containing protein [Aquihabitans sp.]